MKFTTSESEKDISHPYKVNRGVITLAYCIDDNDAKSICDFMNKEDSQVSKSKPVPPLHVMYPAGLEVGDVFVFWHEGFEAESLDLTKYALNLCVKVDDITFRRLVESDWLYVLQTDAKVIKVRLVQHHLCDDSYLTVRKEETSRSYTLACPVCGREKSYDIIVNKSAYP